MPCTHLVGENTTTGMRPYYKAVEKTGFGLSTGTTNGQHTVLYFRQAAFANISDETAQ